MFKYLFLLVSLFSTFFVLAQEPKKSFSFSQWFENLYSKPIKPYEEFYFPIKAASFLTLEDVQNEQKPVAVLFSNQFESYNEPQAKWLIAVSQQLQNEDYLNVRDVLTQFNQEGVEKWYKSFKKNEDTNRNWKDFNLYPLDLKSMQQALAEVFSQNSFEDVFPEKKASFIKESLNLSKGLNASVNPFFYKTQKGDILIATSIVVHQTQVVVCSANTADPTLNFDNYKDQLSSKNLDPKVLDQALALYKETGQKQDQKQSCSYVVYSLQADPDTLKKMLLLNKNYYQYNPFPVEGLTSFALSNTSGFSSTISSYLNTINSQLKQFQAIGWSSPALKEYVDPIGNPVIIPKSGSTPINNN
jgi:hypothetical protein